MNRLVDHSLSQTLESRAQALEAAERRLAFASRENRPEAERRLRLAKESLRSAENVAIQYVTREVSGLLERAFGSGALAGADAGTQGVRGEAP